MSDDTSYQKIIRNEKRLEKIEHELALHYMNGQAHDNIVKQLKELEQWFNIHGKDSMSHHDVDKELIGLVKKNEQLEQKIDGIMGGYKEWVAGRVREFSTRIDKLEAVLKRMLEKFEEEHDQAIHRDFFTGLLKQLDGTSIEGEPSIKKICFNCEWLEGNYCRSSKGSVNTGWTCENWNPKPRQKEEQEALKPKFPFHRGEVKPLIKKEAEPVNWEAKFNGLLNDYSVLERKYNKQIAEFLSDLDKVLSGNLNKTFDPCLVDIIEKWESRRDKQRETEGSDKE